MGKIDIVLSYVGGLFSLLFTGIAFFFGSYGQYKYELYVAESVLTDDKGKREKADDMGFLTFFVYTIYDWMDTFGIAPKCLDRLKRIHDIRDESCALLDPVIMLKRIKHLEDICKVLIDDNQEMCLYLTEPMTLEQSAKMRANLTYCDEVLNQIEDGGDRTETIED